MTRLAPIGTCPFCKRKVEFSYSERNITKTTTSYSEEEVEILYTCLYCHIGFYIDDKEKLPDLKNKLKIK